MATPTQNAAASTTAATRVLISPELHLTGPGSSNAEAERDEHTAGYRVERTAHPRTTQNTRGLGDRTCVPGQPGKSERREAEAERQHRPERRGALRQQAREED